MLTVIDPKFCRNLSYRFRIHVNFVNSRRPNSCKMLAKSTIERSLHQPWKIGFHHVGVVSRFAKWHEKGYCVIH